MTEKRERCKPACKELILVEGSDTFGYNPSDVWLYYKCPVCKIVYSSDLKIEEIFLPSHLEYLKKELHNAKIEKEINNLKDQIEQLKQERRMY